MLCVCVVWCDWMRREREREREREGMLLYDDDEYWLTLSDVCFSSVESYFHFLSFLCVFFREIKAFLFLISCFIFIFARVFVLFSTTMDGGWR